MSSQCPYCNQIVPYGADINMPINHDNTLGKALLDTFGGKEKTYTEADLQEKLKVAFVTGYELGHNDTVESQYTDAEDRYEDSKDDIIELIKQGMSR